MGAKRPLYCSYLMGGCRYISGRSPLIEVHLAIRYECISGRRPLISSYLMVRCSTNKRPMAAYSAASYH